MDDRLTWYYLRRISEREKVTLSIIRLSKLIGWYLYASNHTLTIAGCFIFSTINSVFLKLTEALKKSSKPLSGLLVLQSATGNSFFLVIPFGEHKTNQQTKKQVKKKKIGIGASEGA